MIKIISQNSLATLALKAICSDYPEKITRKINIYYIDKHTNFEENIFSTDTTTSAVNVIICSKDYYTCLKNIVFLNSFRFITTEREYNKMRSNIHSFIKKSDTYKSVQNYIKKTNKLSIGEEQIIQFFIRGMTPRIISKVLNKSEKQVSTLKRSAMKKLNAKNNCELLQRGRLVVTCNPG